jgi:hypothetical protein
MKKISLENKKFVLDCIQSAFEGGYIPMIDISTVEIEEHSDGKEENLICGYYTVTGKTAFAGRDFRFRIWEDADDTDIENVINGIDILCIA